MFNPTRRQAMLGLGLSILAPTTARANDRVLYLFPTVPTLPAFAPFHVAKAKGYFADNRLDITFQAAKGGVDGAKMVGAGHADFSGGIGDTPMIVRANGIPTRAVALLGGRPLHQLVVRKAVKFTNFADLKGKNVGVVALQDTSYFNLLAVIASVGLRKEDLNIQAVGPSGVTQLMVKGQLDAIVGAPEWGITIENNGTPVDMLQIDAVFPAMAQAVLTRDENIKTRPDIIKRLVASVLGGLRFTMESPAEAAGLYLKEVGRPDTERRNVERILEFYAKTVYPPQRGLKLGEFDAKQVAFVQDFYLKSGIIASASRVEDLFTNQFVG
jgi:NitT/TauT family transport system substrate-binding protein